MEDLETCHCERFVKSEAHCQYANAGMLRVLQLVKSKPRGIGKGGSGESDAPPPPLMGGKFYTFPI